jgi:NAD-dependent deacetylase
MDVDDAMLDEIAALVQRSRRILFITGAGMSADSGLPTYRGIGGLYEDQLTEEAIPIEEALSGGMLVQRPDVTWKYLLEIERACRAGSHNRGHEVIAQIEEHVPGTWVLTQNVDGFHHAAGSRNLIEIHGRIADLHCIRCPFRVHVANCPPFTTYPQCPHCGGLVRPEVVLFGEALPERALQTLFDQLDRGFDLVFSIGTTSVFPYIAEPVIQARIRGLPTVEINPARSEVSDVVHYKLRGRAADVLDRLWSRIRHGA